MAAANASTTRKTSNPRRANGTQRDRVRRRVLAEEDICWLCEKPVDKTLPMGLDGSPEVDEIIPVGLGGDPLDRSNCRLAHRLCNNKRGQETKRQIAAARGRSFVTTRKWRLGASPAPRSSSHPPA